MFQTTNQFPMIPHENSSCTGTEPPTMPGKQGKSKTGDAHQNIKKNRDYIRGIYGNISESMIRYGIFYQDYRKCGNEKYENIGNIGNQINHKLGKLHLKFTTKVLWETVNNFWTMRQKCRVKRQKKPKGHERENWLDDAI